MIKKRSYYEKNGVCTFYDFASELSYEELLTVNGGCGGGTTSKSSQSGPTGKNSGSTGSYMVSITGNIYGGSGTTCVGGACAGGGGSPAGKTNIPRVEILQPQKAYNEKDYHCDIYAWNLAIANGVDPTKGSKVVIDLNQNTVSDMYKEYFSSEEVSKGICKKGTKGFAFYDGTDDGVFNPTHVEFYDDTDSSSYYYVQYSTDGIKNPQKTQRSTSDARNKNWTYVAL